MSNSSEEDWGKGTLSNITGPKSFLPCTSKILMETIGREDELP
jgi:hypothetical protein